MNYLKGWKNKMVDHYGRKIIREKEVKRNKIIIALISAGVIAGITGIVSYAISNKDEVVNEPEVISAEYIANNIKQFGTYDDKLLVNEIIIDWAGNDVEFVPLDCDLDVETQEFVFHLCEAYQIDWTLVMAMMKHESSYKSDIVSRTNDYGLMQINECNHEWLAETLDIKDFLDKEQNIRAGVFVLRKLFEEYTEPGLVLMAYNMGNNSAENLWKKGIYSTPYVQTILKYQAEFTEELEGKKND